MTQQLKDAGLYWLCACGDIYHYPHTSTYYKGSSGLTYLTHVLGGESLDEDFKHPTLEQGAQGFCSACSKEVLYGDEWLKHIVLNHIDILASVGKASTIDAIEQLSKGQVPQGEPLQATIGEPVPVSTKEPSDEDQEKLWAALKAPKESDEDPPEHSGLSVEFQLNTNVEKAPSYIAKTPSPASYKAELWGIEPKLVLSTECADFYLLMLMSMTEFERKEEAKDAFDFKLTYLLSQFRRYTDMAVGGELRHTRSRASKTATIPKPLKDALANSSMGSGSRSVAWNEWYYFRKRYGTIALKWAEAAFLVFKGGGYGGPKWANIANTLRRYEEGKLSALAFVDTCWGLQHNGGIYFSKAWATGGSLTGLLNANLASDYETLLTGATAPVKSFVQDAFNEGWNFETLKTGVKI